MVQLQLLEPQLFDSAKQSSKVSSLGKVGAKFLFLLCIPLDHRRSGFAVVVRRFDPDVNDLLQPAILLLIPQERASVEGSVADADVGRFNALLCLYESGNTFVPPGI